jgi:ribosomal protein L40E
MRDWMTEPRAVRRPVGHATYADRTPKAPKRYETHRVCVRCSARLSSYNASEICGPCAREDT